MKYVIVIPDGCADEPLSELDGKTPLQAAETPAMDEVASSGLVGVANHTPSHLPAGSAVANMSLLGYDPVSNFTGRAPLEAAAQNIQLGEHDWAIRCNLVNISDQVMKSFTAGHISSKEARSLLLHAQQQMNDPRLEFVPGVSYRNLLLYRGNPSQPAPFSVDTRTTPPHDLSDRSVENDFPRGPGSELLSQLMSSSFAWFDNHDVNRSRIQQNALPATNIWLWGLGRQPALSDFESIYHLRGAMITAVDLLRGLAQLIGWACIEVPGATGYTDTDYAAKGRYAIDALAEYDIVCVHVEAPDEASHEGDAGKKTAALEDIDRHIVRPLLDALRDQEFRMLVTPDHPTFIRTKTHTHGDVPFAICGSGINADGAQKYDEQTACKGEHRYPQGFKLMPFFISQ